MFGAESRRFLFDQEVKQWLEARDWERLEFAFFDYGVYLMKNPEENNL